MKYELPINYDLLTSSQRREVRLQYIKEQNNLCHYCNCDLSVQAPDHITDNKPINWKLFPDGFMRYPIHLQHNHTTGMTEGAVHNYCNAIMWQYHGK